MFITGFFFFCHFGRNPVLIGMHRISIYIGIGAFIIVFPHFPVIIQNFLPSTDQHIAFFHFITLFHFGKPAPCNDRCNRSIRRCRQIHTGALCFFRFLVRRNFLLYLYNQPGSRFVYTCPDHRFQVLTQGQLQCIIVDFLCRHAIGNVVCT